MTIEIVKARLDTLLRENTARVLLLTGGWGAGKTYQWKAALQRSAVTGNRPRYAYVSLFGLTSLAEVRKRVAEEMVAAVAVPETGGATLGTEIQNLASGLKLLKLAKLLPIIPYVSKLEGLANELSFFTVRDAVVCFDDLERGGRDLRIADVLGLALFLKEERRCRVVLISNQEKLSTDSKDELLLYLEKVVDETLHFAPTTTEACAIALGEAPNQTRAQVRDRIFSLGVSNIRLVARLAGMADELGVLLDGLHPKVLEEAISTLVLFGVAHFSPNSGFPTTEHLLTLGTTWGRFFRRAKKQAEETEEDRKLAKWQDLLDRYGYTETVPIDKEIARAVEAGYFDKDALLPLARARSQLFSESGVLEEFHAVWDSFWRSLRGDGPQWIERLRDITSRASSIIGPGDLNSAYDVFASAGRADIAEDVLDRYIADHQHRPGVFDAPDSNASNIPFNERVAARFREESAKHKPPLSIVEALDRIAEEQQFRPENVRILRAIVEEEIKQILLASEGKTFHFRLRALLLIGRQPDASETDVRISTQTLVILRTMAQEDPINAIRMRRYLPAEAAGEVQSDQGPPV